MTAEIPEIYSISGYPREKLRRLKFELMIQGFYLRHEEVFPGFRNQIWGDELGNSVFIAEDSSGVDIDIEHPAGPLLRDNM